LALLFPLLLWSLELKPNARYVCYLAKVSDGDTLRCRFPYPVADRVRTYPVRLIGVDAPENDPRKRNAKKQERELEELIRKLYGKRVDLSAERVAELGRRASRFVERLLLSVYAVVVETDARPFDRYGRVLAYVWLPDGTLLNEKLVCEGYALPLSVPPNLKYEDRIWRCFEKAVREKRGLWGELVD